MQAGSDSESAFFLPMNNLKTSEKLCPSCGNWSKWNQLEDGFCEHCNNKLTNYKGKEKIREANFKKQNFGFFEVKPNENGFVKFLKKSTNLIAFLFISFVSFILWIISTIAP
jgi:predicted amidophosphoribosyltransferase